MLPRWWLLGIRYSTFRLAESHASQSGIHILLLLILFGDSCPRHNEISTSHKHMNRFVHRNVKLDLVLNKITYSCLGKIQTLPVIKSRIGKRRED